MRGMQLIDRKSRDKFNLFVSPRLLKLPYARPHGPVIRGVTFPLALGMQRKHFSGLRWNLDVGNPRRTKSSDQGTATQVAYSPAKGGDVTRP